MTHIRIISNKLYKDKNYDKRRIPKTCGTYSNAGRYSRGISGQDNRKHHCAVEGEKEGGRKCQLNQKTNLAIQRIGRR